MAENGFVGFHGWQKSGIVSSIPLVRLSSELFTDCSLIFLAYQKGINYESSFEAAILANTDHCQIWGYDFSVKSFGPEIPESQAHRTHFHAYGLSGTDAHSPDDKIPMYTLETLLKMNGTRHLSLDVSKIEG